MYKSSILNLYSHGKQERYQRCSVNFGITKNMFEFTSQKHTGFYAGLMHTFAKIIFQLFCNTCFEKLFTLPRFHHRFRNVFAIIKNYKSLFYFSLSINIWSRFHSLSKVNFKLKPIQPQLLNQNGRSQGVLNYFQFISRKTYLVDFESTLLIVLHPFVVFGLYF